MSENAREEPPQAPRASSLSAKDRALLNRAREAASAAYCPYSKFPVGAAVETDAGTFVGCNVENAVYGLAICAERVALFAAVTAGAKEFRRLAVCCAGADPGGSLNSRMPCGACRQVMAEFMPADSIVIVEGAGVWSIETLLPVAFRIAPE